LSSLVPHYGISWQGHASGAVGGVVAAWLLARERQRPGPQAVDATRRAGAIAR
jgi:membrane associated rhomboid family serine protease